VAGHDRNIAVRFGVTVYFVFAKFVVKDVPERIGRDPVCSVISSKEY